MITGIKKWSVYGMLPKEVNKIYIYAPAYYGPTWENKIDEIRKYLLARTDTVAKVVRLTAEEAEWFEMMPEDFIIMYDDKRIQEPFINNLKAVLKEPELEPPIIELIKLLKDGEDLL